MINAAFAIATPQAGTEFYNDLDSKGLIDVRDWTMYDQMHGVFRHESISRVRLEQLLAHCMGRFYAPDIFIDDMIEGQFRNTDGRKTTLNEALRYFRARLDFILVAGTQYRPNDGQEHGNIFLGAQINPWTRKRTEKIGVHNMMQIEAFLKAFGDQKVQISLSRDGIPFVNYVLKTTKTKVEYLDVCEEAHEDATLTLELDLNEIDNKNSKIVLNLLYKVMKRGQLFTLLRGAFAGLVDHLAVTKSAKRTDLMILPSEYWETGCAMDGWDGDG
jgi:hypothetical protein